MYKRFFCIIITLIGLINGLSVSAVSVSASASVLMNADTLTVYYEKNMNTKLPMASTTKIMTAVILCENAKLDGVVKVTYDMVAVEGSSMGLREGDRITYYGLLCGMLLASGNDAANTVAISIAGSTENFAKLMNEKAKEIGMKNTNFVTPSGLDDERHYSTAYDMALLASYALKNQVIRDVVSQKSIQIEFGNPDIKQTIRNHNRLLSIYENCIGIKTGFTKKSGRCLVSAAEKDGVKLIAVTLNAPSDWNDHCDLYDYGFLLFSDYDISKTVVLKDVNLVGGNKNKASIKIEEKQIKSTEKDIEKLSYKVHLPRYIYASSGCDKVGRVDYFFNNNYFASSDIYVNNDYSIKREKQGLFYRFLTNLYNLFCV